MHYDQLFNIPLSLSRLKEIAGDSFADPPGKVKTKSKESDFVCPYDGHFGDPKDCSKFYRLSLDQTSLRSMQNCRGLYNAEIGNFRPLSADVQLTIAGCSRCEA